MLGKPQLGPEHKAHKVILTSVYVCPEYFASNPLGIRLVANLNEGRTERLPVRAKNARTVVVTQRDQRLVDEKILGSVVSDWISSSGSKETHARSFSDTSSGNPLKMTW